MAVTKGDQLGRERDSQRQKLYRSERFLQERGSRYESVQDIQKYVDRLIASAWFRRRWPRCARNGILVEDGRGRRTAVAKTRWGDPIISMPVWSRTEAVILHEVAHHCSDERHGTRDVAPHGREFAATLLELITHLMGADTGKELKASFRKNGVKFTAHKGGRTLTPEQRQQQIERLAAAREARDAVPRLRITKTETLQSPWREQRLQELLVQDSSGEPILHQKERRGHDGCLYVLSGITWGRKDARKALEKAAEANPGDPYRATFRGSGGNLEEWEAVWR